MRMFCVAATVAVFLCQSVGAENRVEKLTLERAIQLAEQTNPRLREASANIAGAEGRLQQAGTFPNPELIARVESTPIDGKGDPEYLAGVAQRIPINGSIGKGRQVEKLARERLLSELEATRLAVRKKVHSAFATALYQEIAFETLNEIKQNSEKSVAIAKARVEAGDALSEELARVEIELARNDLELQRATRLREQSLLALKSAIGDAKLQVGSLEGNLESAFEIESLETIAADLSKHPESSAAEAEIQWQRARLDLAKAQRIPDLHVEMLYRRIPEERRNSADFGISFPLPLFNRNKGNVREAEANLAASEARSATKRNELAVGVQQAQAELAATLHEARVLQNEILPRARKVLATAEARYANGDVSLNEVLPARREWAASQLARLEALREVMSAWAELTFYAKK